MTLCDHRGDDHAGRDVDRVASSAGKGDGPAWSDALVDGTRGVSEYDAIVVGCGSMGSAALFHLASRGRRVLGLEQFDVPNQMGSSVGTNRIIRLAYAEGPGYVPLLRRAYTLWHELEQLADERLLLQTGSIDAGPEDGAIVSGSMRSCAEHDLPHEVLDARMLERRFPGYRLPSDMMAIYQPHGGFLMSERCVIAHVNAALARGAHVHGREAVTAWEPIENGSRVRVRTTKAVYDARSLVLTTGPWTGNLTSELRPVAKPERQVQLWVQPMVPEHFRLENFPVFYLEGDEGRFYGFPAYSTTRVQDREVPPPARTGSTRFGRSRLSSARRGVTSPRHSPVLSWRRRPDAGHEGVHVHKHA